MAKEDFRRWTIALKEDDPLLLWLQEKKRDDERSEATTIARILRYVRQLEIKGDLPKII